MRTVDRAPVGGHRAAAHRTGSGPFRHRGTVHRYGSLHTVTDRYGSESGNTGCHLPTLPGVWITRAISGHLRLTQNLELGAQQTGPGDQENQARGQDNLASDCNRLRSGVGRSNTKGDDGDAHPDDDHLEATQ